MTVRAVGDFKLAAAPSPTILNLTCTAANTEYSTVLPNGVRKIALRMRDNTKSAKICFTAAASGTTYFTIDATSWWEDFILSDGSLTIYYQSPDTGAVIEGVYWKI